MSAYLDEIYADISRSKARSGNMALIQQLLGSLGGARQGAPATRMAGSPAGYLSRPAGGNVDAWISRALRQVGQPDSPSLHNAVRILVQRESGGNPRAINRWDSNARAGHPSMGLAQTIPSTFAAYRDPRLSGDILDPIANLVAGLRYGASRYGSIMGIPGISSVLRGGAYRGY